MCRGHLLYPHNTKCIPGDVKITISPMLGYLKAKQKFMLTWRESVYWWISDTGKVD